MRYIAKKGTQQLDTSRQETQKKRVCKEGTIGYALISEREWYRTFGALNKSTEEMKKCITLNQALLQNWTCSWSGLVVYRTGMRMKGEVHQLKNQTICTGTQIGAIQMIKISRIEPMDLLIKETETEHWHSKYGRKRGDTNWKLFRQCRRKAEWKTKLLSSWNSKRSRTAKMHPENCKVELRNQKPFFKHPGLHYSIHNAHCGLD